jgi:hypothetical protein
MNIKGDFETLVDQIGKRKGYVKRTVTETVDSMGRVTDISTTDSSSIDGIVREVSPDDEKLLSIGWVKYGDYVGWFKAEDGVEEHDQIVDGNTVYEVIRVADRGIVGETAFLHQVILRRVEG